MPQYTTGKPELKTFTVPPGEYKLKVVEATEDTSKSGNDQIKLKLRVLNKDGSDGPCLFDYLVFNKNCLWKVDAFLSSAGQHPGGGVGFEVKADDLIGYEVTAKLKVETYEGKESNKVETYLFNEF